MITDDHRSTNAVRKSSCEVNLLCSHAARVRLYADQNTANAKRSGVYVVTTCYRREILRRALGNFLVAPKKLAGLRIHSDHAFAQTLHILFAPASLDHDR